MYSIYYTNYFLYVLYVLPTVTAERTFETVCLVLFSLPPLASSHLLDAMLSRQVLRREQQGACAAARWQQARRRHGLQLSLSTGAWAVGAGARRAR